MDDEKHTPGPWFAKFEAGRYLINHQGAFGPFKTLAITGGFYPSSESNARLIAAAPDLLEACQTFEEWLRREEEGFEHIEHPRDTPEGEAKWREWYDTNLEICSKAQQLARAAIAKATGSEVL